MSGVSKGIDPVAEVLKKLKGKQTVSPEEANKAIEQYNKMKGEGHSSKALDKLRDENKTLKEKITNLESQLSELKNRLSKIAGEKVTDNNPDITDLSDPFRPTKLAEKFKQLYDDEWTHAFEELERKFSNEGKIVEILNTITKEIETFCKNAHEQTVKKMKPYLREDLVAPKIELPAGKGTPAIINKSVMNKKQEELFDKMVRELRKSFGELAVRPLTEIFAPYIYEKLQAKWNITGSNFTGLNEYIRKNMELIWMMKIQNPPMELVWADEGKHVDKNMFTFYTKTGEIVQLSVWPAVLLYKTENDGPVVSKGVVQGK